MPEAIKHEVVKASDHSPVNGALAPLEFRRPKFWPVENLARYILQLDPYPRVEILTLVS